MTDILFRKFAHVLVESALNLQYDDTLIIRAAPVDYLFVREVITAAYQMGARFVHVEYEDNAADPLRCLYAGDEYLEYCPQWIKDYMARSAADRIAVLILHSPDPMINGGLDEERLLRIKKGKRQAARAFNMARSDGHVSIVKTAVPSVQWARAVYPELDDTAAYARLWADFSKVVRLNSPDPIEAWRIHKEDLRRHKEMLNALHIQTLYFSGPGTELEIGLAKGTGWTGGYDINPVTGLEYIPNIPTEELFAVPDKWRVNGKVRATMAMNHNGSLIQGFSFVVKEGRVVSYTAEAGGRILRDILRTDGGARYFGEISLVPVTSPIYQTGRVFYDTLLDENAVCHMALGNALVSAGKDGQALGKNQREAAGLNCSQVHVDFMIGSEQIDVDARLEDGAHIALMRKGLWVI